MKKISTLFVLFLSFVILGRAQTYPWAEFHASEDSYINLGDSSHLNGYDSIFGGKEISITMWIRWGDKENSGTGNWANFFTLSDSTAGDDGVFWMQHDWGNTKFEFAIHTVNGRKYLHSTTNPQEGTWYHFAATYDHTIPEKNMKLYIDGNLEATKNHTGVIKTLTDRMKLTVGRWPSPANNYRMFHGDIDEVSIWSKALTQTDILTLMNNPVAVMGSAYDTSDIISYYDFTGGMVDRTGHNTASAGESVLPVELSEFSVNKQENHVNLFWVTLSETNNDFFTIEKTNNLEEYDFVEDVLGSGTTNIKQTYRATDYNPYPGVSYYRLSQTDFDGKTNVLATKTIEFNTNDFEVQLYPNPIIQGSSFYIKIPFVVESDYNVLINDLLGKECIYDLSMIQQENQTLLLIQTEQDVEPGLYLITFELGNELISKKIYIK